MSGKTELNNCGCCASQEKKNQLHNRPGLKRLDYRIDVYGSFFQRMLSRLSTEEIPDGDLTGQRPLGELTTRETDDFSIGLLDAWATVSDVLTFYQERIANEGFLRTATERLSVLELARAIGYELEPGVAAETYLVFTVDESESTPPTIEIPLGTKVQSLPQKQDELPQTFETGKAFIARPAWNRFLPRQRSAQHLSPSTTTILFEGIATNLQTGDHLLLVGTEKQANHDSPVWDVRRVLSVSTDPAANQTSVSVPVSSRKEFPTAPKVYAFREQAAIFGHNAVAWAPLSDQIKTDYLGHAPDPGERQEWPRYSIFVPGSTQMKQLKQLTKDSGAPLSAATAREQAELAIITAAEKKPGMIKVVSDTIDLDNRYSAIVAGSWLLFATGSKQELYSVDSVAETSRAEYLISAKVTRLQLDGPSLSDYAKAVRELTVYAAPEELTLAEVAIPTMVSGTELVVDSSLPALLPEQPLVVSGTTGTEEQTVAETVVVKTFQQSGNHSTITLKKSLSRSYLRSSVEIFGNVVPATHGETTAEEVLGNGSGAAAHQSFILKQAPLTYTAAPTDSGGQTSLTVRVDDIAWKEADSLYLQPPTAKVYTVRRDNQGRSHIHFGDGRMGARLPTGMENISATYRSGTGQAGEVAAGTLTLLKTKPYGVKGVVNPVAADGAEDPEQLESARSNAPMTVRTLDRVVSRWDYEDFAATFSGIGKAQALPLWDGSREIMHITVADPTGAPLSSEKIDLLTTALERVRDPLCQVIVENFLPKTFSLSARITVTENSSWTTVQAAMQALLLNRFSFAGRQFGQTVSAAEIMTALHEVQGVTAVDLDQLFMNQAGQDYTLNSVLGPGIATYNRDSTAALLADRITPAGLLTIASNGIDLKEYAL